MNGLINVAEGFIALLLCAVTLVVLIRPASPAGVSEPVGRDLSADDAEQDSLPLAGPTWRPVFAYYHGLALYLGHYRLTLRSLALWAGLRWH